MKHHIKIFACFLVIYFSVFWLRGGYVSFWGLDGVCLASFVGFFAFQFATFFCFYKLKDKTRRPLFTLLTILLAISILELPGRIILESTAVSLGSYLMFLCGAVSGFLIFKAQPIILKAGLFIISTLFVFWFSYSGYPMWLHKISHGSFTGRIDAIFIQSPVIFQNTAGEDVDLADYKGKYVFLDFWTSTCGVCIAAFPEIQRIYEQTEKNSMIEMFSVFCIQPKRGETFATGGYIVRERAFRFPVVSIDIDNPALAEMDVRLFPKVIIFDPEGKMAFEGNLKMAIKYLSAKQILKE